MQWLQHEVAHYDNRQYIAETHYKCSNRERLNGSKSIQSKSTENMTVFTLELMKFYFTDSLLKPKFSEFSKWIWKEMYSKLVRSGYAEFLFCIPAIHCECGQWTAYCLP